MNEGFPQDRHFDRSGEIFELSHKIWFKNLSTPRCFSPDDYISI